MQDLATDDNHHADKHLTIENGENGTPTAVNTDPSRSTSTGALRGDGRPDPNLTSKRCPCVPEACVRVRVSQSSAKTFTVGEA